GGNSRRGGSGTRCERGFDGLHPDHRRDGGVPAYDPGAHPGAIPRDPRCATEGAFGRGVLHAVRSVHRRAHGSDGPQDITERCAQNGRRSGVTMSSTPPPDLPLLRDELARLTLQLCAIPSETRLEERIADHVEALCIDVAGEEAVTRIGNS